MKYLLSLVIGAAALLASAQDTAQIPADSIPFEFRKQAFIYSMGKKYNDPSVSRMALYNLIAANPQSTALRDSLAILYFDYQQYASAALVAQDVLTIDPNDLFAAEVAALSFESIGVKNRAVTYYEKLYLANNDIGILYKVAFLQYELKRYEEALTNADVIIGSPESEKLKLLFPGKDNQDIEVTLKASAHRLKGMVEKAKGNTEKAKEHFGKALELAPDFEVVKEQLAELDK